MTAKTSSDWLPPSWTLQFKFQKTGRRITHYVNLETGQKFFTKDDLIRYTQTASTCHEQQLTLRQIKMPSAKGHTNNATRANERPEWLPKNWFVELKTYKSGSKIGKPYKMYVDPSTGSRFHSKPEVFRFLNEVEKKSSISELKKRASHSTSKTAVEATECPEWLPKNWSMELKTCHSGAKIGRHYKIYIDPSTGVRFYSRPQVFRFLNHVKQKSSKSKQKKRASHSTSRVVIEKSAADDLPAGWIKEVKIKRHANRVRRDPYYTDPATGYVFRSKKGALHYLETGEISRRALLRKKKHGDDQNLRNNEKSQVAAAKRQKVEHPVITGQVFTGSETSERSTLSHLEAETFEKGKSKEDDTETSLTAASILNPQRKDSVEIATKRNQTAEISSWSGSVAPKASKRNQAKVVSAGNILVSTAATDVLQVKKKNLLQSKRQKRSNINSKNSSKSKYKKELDLPRRFSKRLARLEPELVASGLELVKPCQNEATCPCFLEDEATQQLHIGFNAEMVEHASADSTVKSHWGSVKKNIKSIDIDVGMQPQMLKSGKISDTKSEVQPFFCPDSSSDFAVKNLTGATSLQAAANEELVLAPALTVQQKKNRGKTRMTNKSSNIEAGNLTNFKKMKEFDLPRRSSKRLIGRKPEPGANGVPNEVSLQNAATKSGKRKQKSPCALVNKAIRQPVIGCKTKLPNQDSAAAVNPEINSKRHHEGAILGERQQVLETRKGGDSQLEQELVFCSDPCLDFAIKTLTGAIPLEVAINEGLISTPTANFQQQKNLPETRIEHGSCRKTLFSSTMPKKDCSLPQCSSKRLAGPTTELAANLVSSEQACKTADRRSCINEAIPNADLTSENISDKAFQQIKTGSIMALQHKDFTYRTSVFHLESSSKSKEPHRNQTAPIEMNFEKPGLQSATPWRNSWPDPRFEFAFKAVTGSTAEESFTFQSYFHQQFGSYGSQSDGTSTMPDYGLSNVLRSDISSHVGATAQPVVQVQHQFPVNHPSLSSGKVSLPSCIRVGVQHPHWKENKELPGKVKP